MPELMGLSKPKIIERLRWFEAHRHFPGAVEAIAFLREELVLRFVNA